MRCQRLLALVLLLLGYVPLASGQEPSRFVQRQEWSASGVSVDGIHFAFCVAENDAHSADSVWLQIAGDDAVADRVRVMHVPDDQANGAFLDIGDRHFTLAENDSGDFVASAADGAAMVRAMQDGTQMALRLDGPNGTRRYDYSLAGFADVEAAIASNCRPSP